MAKIFYLYYATTQTPNKDQYGLISSQQKKVIAVDSSIYNSKAALIEIQKEMQLKHFEVCQKDFIALIDGMQYLDIRVTDLKFHYEILDDENEELMQYIQTSNVKDIIKFIQDQKDELGNEIEEITFVPNKVVDRQPIYIKFVSKAIITINTNSTEELDDILNLNAVKVLCGTYIDKR